MTGLVLKQLNKQEMTSRLVEFRRADSDLDWMAWEDDAYLLDLPRKWELSRFAENDGHVLGYALCSAKSRTLWVHRIVISSSARGLGVGTRLIGHISEVAIRNGFSAVALKTPAINAEAIHFYEANGFVGTTEGGEYMEFKRDLTNKTVAIHQPNFFPWLGYFYKIARSDVFVFLDDVLASKGGYVNRSKIILQGDSRWLSVPINKNDGLLHHMTPAGDKWVAKHLATLRQSYRRTPFFDGLIGEISRIMEDYSGRALSELNEALIVHVMSLLKIETPHVRSSDYTVEGVGDRRLVELIDALGGSAYLSGRGGANYQDPETFSSAGIDLLYTRFTSMPYDQHQMPEFVGGLSVLDALFNIGPDETRALIDGAPAPEPASSLADGQR